MKEHSKKLYKSLFQLDGKCTVLTGATGLIGSAFAEGLAEYGSNIAIVDVDEHKCLALADKLSDRHSVECISVVADVSKVSSVNDLLAKVLDKFGKIDVLVNSVQVISKNFFLPFEEYKEDDWNEIIDINLKGVFLTCQIIGKQMVAQEKGNIINLASTYALVAPNQKLYEGIEFGSPAAYSASKGGVIALSRYLAAYWAAQNIRVNTITPHGVYKNHESRFIKNFSNLSPLKRMSRKEEVVGALIYLASEASSYVTGHNLVVDGGWGVW